MERDGKVSITICGDGGTGKSSLTLRLVRSQWSNEYDPTIEDSYSVTRNVDGRPYFLELTDTAGQEEYRGLFSSSNLHSDAFLLVYDITQESTLEALNYYSDLIGIETDQRLDTGAVPPVKIVAGNKCDLGTQGLRRVEARTGLEWARQRGCGFMETSAREMVNVEETFALLVRRVIEARKIHSDTYATPSTVSPTKGAAATSPNTQLPLSAPHLSMGEIRAAPPIEPLTGHAQGVTAPLTPLDEKEEAFNRSGAMPMTSDTHLQGSGFYKRTTKWNRTKHFFKRICTVRC